MAARGSKADQEWDRRDRAARRALLQELESVSDYGQAMKLALAGPSPTAPGRSYHSNLAFFLGQFIVPAGSDWEEREAYARLVSRLDAAGQLKPGVAAEVIAALQA